MTTQTFHPFSRLPAEIRFEIWGMSIEPRIVELCCGRESCRWMDRPPHSRTGIERYSPTRVPATLQACQEARNQTQKFYQQIFLDQVIHGDGARDAERRYVWLNWDTDTISIGESDLRCFKSAASLIKRLKLWRDNGDESWSYFESLELSKFTNVIEVHVDCRQGWDIRQWHGASEDIEWPCSPERVFVEHGTQIMRLTDLENLCDRELEEAHLKEDPSSRIRFHCGHAYDPEYYPF